MEQDFLYLTIRKFRDDALRERDRHTPTTRSVVDSGINATLENALSAYQDVITDISNQPNTFRFILALIIVKVIPQAPFNNDTAFYYLEYVKCFTQYFSQFTDAALSEYSRCIIKEFTEDNERLLLQWAEKLSIYYNNQALLTAFQCLINSLNSYALKCSLSLFQEFDNNRLNDMTKIAVFIFKIDVNQVEQINLCGLLALRLIIDWYDLEGISKATKKPYQENKQDAKLYYKRIKSTSSVFNDENKQFLRKTKNLLKDVRESPDVIERIESYNHNSAIQYQTPRIHHRVFKGNTYVEAYRATDGERNMIVKIYYNYSEIPGFVDSLIMESRILATLSEARKYWPMFLEYYGSFQNEQYYYLFMEDGGISLMDYLTKLRNEGKIVDPIILRNWIHELLLTFEWLSTKGIYHKDIKPHNIVVNLVSDPPILKLIDFSASDITHENNNSIFSLMPNAIQGTEGYIAPELFVASNNPNEKFKYRPARSDVFSLGLTILQCFTLKTELGLNNPKCHDALMKEVNSIEADRYIKDLLEGMLRVNPDERFSFKKCLEFLKPHSNVYSFNQYANK